MKTQRLRAGYLKMFPGQRQPIFSKTIMCSLIFSFVLVNGFDGGDCQANELEATASVAAKEPHMLSRGKRFQSRIVFEDADWQTFRITVPENAIQIDLKLDGAVGDLDLYMKHEVDMADWDEADYSAQLADFNERLTLTKWDHEFLPGVYFVDVVYFGGRTPRVDGKRVDRIDFGLTYNYVVATRGEELKAGEVVDSEIEIDNALMSFFHVDVPRSADCLRIDLLDAEHALDLYISESGPISLPGTADYASENWARNKAIVIDEESDPPLRAGTYYIAVRDFVEIESPFSLRTSFSPEAPADRLEIAKLPEAKTPLAHARLSTAMLVMNSGMGSGTVLTPDGLILTNYHVVEDYEKGLVPMEEDVIIAFATTASEPVREMFLGEIIELDKEHDLALVQVKSGIYGQPVPEDYEFLYTPIAEEPLPTFGDELLMIGFPTIGSSSSGAYVSMTRGIVAGFDRAAEGLMIKTDADIASGNSGGSGLNTNYQLIGVPTQSISESDDNGQMGYLVPTTSIPEQWREMIKSRLDD